MTLSLPPPSEITLFTGEWATQRATHLWYPNRDPAIPEAAAMIVAHNRLLAATLIVVERAAIDATRLASDAARSNRLNARQAVRRAQEAEAQRQAEIAAAEDVAAAEAAEAEAIIIATNAHFLTFEEAQNSMILAIADAPGHLFTQQEKDLRLAEHLTYQDKKPGGTGAEFAVYLRHATEQSIAHFRQETDDRQDRYNSTQAGAYVQVGGSQSSGEAHLC